MQLIKLQDKFILVNDEEIKEGDWYYDWINELTKIVDFSIDCISSKDGKIIAGIPELPEIDFSLLSEEELSNITTANVEVILENNVYLITKIIKDENL